MWGVTVLHPWPENSGEGEAGQSVLAQLPGIPSEPPEQAGEAVFFRVGVCNPAVSLGVVRTVRAPMTEG